MVVVSDFKGKIPMLRNSYRVSDITQLPRSIYKIKSEFTSLFGAQ